tara:strand:- start:22 stop:639 length:618 start_codon:yes stop_codon:yes gene_type:complete
MEKKRFNRTKKRIIGISLIVLSIGIIISNVSITGAVIGTSISNSLSLIAIVFLFIGTMLLISERKTIESKIEQLVASGVTQSEITGIQEGIQAEYKTMPKEKRKAIYEEIYKVINEIKSSRGSGGSGRSKGTYNLHTFTGIPRGLTEVPPKTKLLGADAKVLNKYVNQKGRGTERYVFDKSTQKLLGIAYHPRGDTEQLNWRKRF